MAECVSKNNRPESRWVSIAVAAAILLGLGWRMFCWRLDPVISRDGVYYISLIERIRDGVPMNTAVLQPLLYIELAGRIAALGVPVEIAAIGINLLCGALLPLLMFLICEQLWHDRTISFIALALGMLYPPFVKWSYMIQRESLYLFLTSAAILLAIWSYRKRYCLGFFCCGAVAALAVWTRYEGIELVALLVGEAILTAFFDRQCRRIMPWWTALGGAGLILGYVLTAWFVHQPLVHIFTKVSYRL